MVLGGIGLVLGTKMAFVVFSGESGNFAGANLKAHVGTSSDPNKFCCSDFGAGVTPQYLFAPETLSRCITIARFPDNTCAGAANCGSPDPLGYPCPTNCFAGEMSCNSVTCKISQYNTGNCEYPASLGSCVVLPTPPSGVSPDCGNPEGDCQWKKCITIDTPFSCTCEKGTGACTANPPGDKAVLSGPYPNKGACDSAACTAPTCAQLHRICTSSFPCCNPAAPANPTLFCDTSLTPSRCKTCVADHSICYQEGSTTECCSPSFTCKQESDGVRRCRNCAGLDDDCSATHLCCTGVPTQLFCNTNLTPPKCKQCQLRYGTCTPGLTGECCVATDTCQGTPPRCSPSPVDSTGTVGTTGIAGTATTGGVDGGSFTTGGDATTGGMDDDTTTSGGEDVEEITTTEISAPPAAGFESSSWWDWFWPW